MAWKLPSTDSAEPYAAKGPLTALKIGRKDSNPEAGEGRRTLAGPSALGSGSSSTPERGKSPQRDWVDGNPRSGTKGEAELMPVPRPAPLVPSVPMEDADAATAGTTRQASPRRAGGPPTPQLGSSLPSTSLRSPRSPRQPLGSSFLAAERAAERASADLPPRKDSPVKPVGDVERVKKVFEEPHSDEKPTTPSVQMMLDLPLFDTHVVTTHKPIFEQLALQSPRPAGKDTQPLSLRASPEHSTGQQSVWVSPRPAAEPSAPRNELLASPRKASSPRNASSPSRSPQLSPRPATPTTTDSRDNRTGSQLLSTLDEITALIADKLRVPDAVAPPTPAAERPPESVMKHLSSTSSRASDGKKFSTRRDASSPAGSGRARGQSSPDKFIHLPKVILLHVFSYLGVPDLRRAAQVSTKWYRIIQDYAPAISAKKNDLRVDDALLPSGTLSFRVKLPDGSVVSGEFPSTHTVEQVKRDLFRQASALSTLSKDSYYLGLSMEAVLTNEGSLFVYSNETITRAVTTKTLAQLVLELYQKSAVHMKHRSYGAEVPAGSLLKMSQMAKSQMQLQLFQADTSDRSGYLMKSAPGKFSTSWSKRWCVIKNNFLCYFRRKEDSQPAGAIALPQCCGPCEPLPSKRFGFDVKTRVRVYQFAAADAEEASLWMQSLNSCIGAAPQGKQVTSPAYFQVSDKQGWLTKAAPELENWKRRWFILKEGGLYYFKSSQDLNPLGCIVLQGSTVQVADDAIGKKNCFCIITLHRRYYLFAESIKEMKEWMEWTERNISYDPSASSSLLARGGQPTKARMVNILCLERHMQTRSFSRATAGDFQIPSLNLELRKLFGIPSMSYADVETSLFRATVTARAAKMRRADSGDPSLIPVQLVHDPLPATIAPNFILRFWWPDRTYTVIKCEITQSVGDAARLAFKKQQSRGPLSDYHLKVLGRSEYITDLEASFMSLAFVRNYLNRGKKVQISFVRRQPEAKLSASNQLAVPEPEASLETCYPHSEVETPLSLRVVGIEMRAEELSRFLPKGEEVLFFVAVELFYGDRLLAPALKTPKTVKAVWGHVLTSDIKIQQIPHETILCFTFYAHTRKEDIPIGWVNCQLFDFEGRMKSSHQKLDLVVSGESANPLRGPSTDVSNNSSFLLRVEFPPCATPIIHSLPRYAESPRTLDSKPDENTRLELVGLLATDPFYRLSADQKEVLWAWRFYVRKEKPNGLPKLIAAVSWTNPKQVAELHQLLESWPLINPRYALGLLVPQFADIKVRGFAVKCLNQLTDHQLVVYMLQLTSALKYEPYHDSALARFLLTRALNSPLLIGHTLFWNLKSEIHKQEVAFRYGLILEAYLSVCGDQLEELAAQVQLVDALHAIGLVAKGLPDREQRRPRVRAALAQVKLPVSIRLPLNPRFQVSGIIADECKTLDSATVPLWLVFKNADPLGKPISIIYKIGDDLRQDVLTLQMISLMDSYWKADGFDYHLTPYNVLATGHHAGMIEVVMHSMTTAQIHKMYGGVTAAFSKTPLFSWMREQSKSEAKLTSCVQNFTLSLVGYCIGTYVLGIGDRHNDNIMIDKSGHLFHIDFSKFLGNRQLFAGWNRDRAPFVLTHEFVHVMGGEKSPNFENFIRLCLAGYAILRSHVNIFFTLFSMMLSTGIPELRCEEDLDYLRTSFSVDATDEEAAKKFKELIVQSLNTKTTQLNFAVHMLANPK